MNKNQNFRLQKNNTIELINLVIFISGLLLIVCSVIFPSHPYISTISLSVGTSLLASSIVAFLSSKYLIEENEAKEIIRDWGLNGLFETRAEMNHFTNIDLEKNNSKLWIIAFGLESFRNKCDDLIKKKVSNGMEVKIITINPNSKFLVEHEKTEQKHIGSTKKTIIDLDTWVKELKVEQKYESQVEIKYYDSLPLDFHFILDNSIYTGPYLYGQTSQQTISFSFKSKHKAYEYYYKYFEKLWNNNQFCKEMNI